MQVMAFIRVRAYRRLSHPSGSGPACGKIGLVGNRLACDVVPAGFAPEAKALIGVKNSILDFIQGKNQVLSTTGVHWPGARPGPIALGERREVYTPEIRGVLGKRNAEDVEAGPNAQLSQHASLHLQIQSVPMHGELHVPATHARRRYTGAMQTDHFCEASLPYVEPPVNRTPVNRAPWGLWRRVQWEARSESDHCGVCFRWDLRRLGALAGAVADGRGVATGRAFRSPGMDCPCSDARTCPQRERTGPRFGRSGSVKS